MSGTCISTSTPKQITGSSPPGRRLIPPPHRIRRCNRSSGRLAPFVPARDCRPLRGAGRPVAATGIILLSGLPRTEFALSTLHHAFIVADPRPSARLHGKAGSHLHFEDVFAFAGECRTNRDVRKVPGSVLPPLFLS